jgi:MFS family permease
MGRKQLIIIQRFMYIFIPLMFIQFKNPLYFIIPYSVIGVLHAIEGTANISYLYDISPQELRGSYISFFNVVQGSGVFISSLLSGYLIEIFTVKFGLVQALRIVAYISTIARIPTFLLYTKIEEKREFPNRFYNKLFGK